MAQISLNKVDVTKVDIAKVDITKVDNNILTLVVVKRYHVLIDIFLLLSKL